MDFFVMRHSLTNGVGTVPGSALEHHRALGWLRVSDALSDDAYARFDPAAWADAPDLDQQPTRRSTPTVTKES